MSQIAKSHCTRRGMGTKMRKMSIFSFSDAMPLRQDRLLKNVHKRQKSLYAKRHGYGKEKNAHFFVFGCHATSEGATFEKCYRFPKVAIREEAWLRKGEKYAFFRFRMPCHIEFLTICWCVTLGHLGPLVHPLEWLLSRM